MAMRMRESTERVTCDDEDGMGGHTHTHKDIHKKCSMMEQPMVLTWSGEVSWSKVSRTFCNKVQLSEVTGTMFTAM